MSGKDRGKVQDQNDGKRAAKGGGNPSFEASKSKEKSGSSRSGSQDLVALSLRQAYQRTVAESVPDEMMDLLNKLG